METKQCTRCNKTKPLDEFRKGNYGLYGRRSRCKDCEREYDKEYKSRQAVREREAKRSKNRKLTRKYDYGDRYKGRYDWSKYRQTVDAWHERNPDARKAYRMIKKAIRHNGMPKASECTCVHCGKRANDYHHHNGYGVGHELDVIALCHSCHRIAHEKLV